jgi:glutathionyl-hydroquinone reductase
MAESFLAKLKVFLDENIKSMENQVVMVVVEATPKGEPVGATGFVGGSTYTTLGMLEQVFNKTEELRNEIISAVENKTVVNKESIQDGKRSFKTSMDDMFSKLPLHLLPQELRDNIEAQNKKIIDALSRHDYPEFDRLRTELFEQLKQYKSGTDESKFDDFKDNF